MEFGIAAYSFPCSCGLARRESQPLATQLDAYGLIELAATWQLSSVEIPFHGFLPTVDELEIDRFKARLVAANLGLVVDTPTLDLVNLQALLPLAARAGAKTVRAMVSGILEGARTNFPGSWSQHLIKTEALLRELAPLLAEYDLDLALENHQDVTSDELLALCAAGGPRVGVTLDVANPLAVGEDVLAFTRKVGPLIRNVHLKDYTIHATTEGYRLVRAALGEGALPWAALLPLLREVAPAATWHIELAALYGRHIRVFDDAWWQGFPPTDVRATLPALSFLAQHALPSNGPWQTPWERGADAADVAAWELAQFERSVAFLRSGV